MLSADVVRVRAPAKVNLHLGVGARRGDGFHEVFNVFHAVDLVDELVARPDELTSLTITGEGAGDLPTDETNLAWQAVALVAETVGLDDPGLRLELDKAIPVAGGMAGGSADAAAALVACARLWGVRADLGELAARLGSDVAFPLLGGTAVGTGRGELLSPLATTGRLHWALALADGGISAGAAYAELDRQRAAGTAPPPAGDPGALLAALAGGDVAGVAATLVNDLQAAALVLRPALADTLAAGAAAGALAGVVSGSGPTCAFLCPDESAADQVAAGLLAAGVCRAARVASGPAPGAHVVA
ncbi:MAG: 4-(cytidine 5'-diphospho)-2-C-methyl-D-erythritol kinase [Jatrophihabitans sp.]|uniref:4-(cytidine 5'-diphospho)-2-C-methyl-D-erythritol kinase n=1 Tax=Jatrophihabitans sp. TaxID=1932789 RepID=UPI00391549EB